MSFGFFRGLLPGISSADPTTDWPESTGTTPEVDLTHKLIGKLKFGSPLVEARYLGKPDSAHYSQPDYLELIYGPGGFRLDFDHGNLAYAAFFIGPDEFQPTVPDLKFCEPLVHGAQRFTANMSRIGLENIFGPAEHVDERDSCEAILSFCRDGLVHEFEFDLNDKLKRWSLFPEQEIPQ